VDFSLSEEQQMLSDGAGKFLADHYSFEQRRALLMSPTGFSEQNWQTFAELGWLALPVPEDAGGLGGSFIDTTLIMEAMGRRLVLEPYATTAVLAARVIAQSRNEQLRSSLLPQIAQGTCRVALAHGELASRYDTRMVQTCARPDEDGYVIDGVKVLALDAPAAHKLIVSANIADTSDSTSIADGRNSAGIADRKNMGLFLLDANAPGVTVRGYPLIDGTRAADVELTAVRANRSTLLAAGPEALEVLEEAIDRLVLARVAEGLGAMEVVLQLASEHLRSRQQFGQPLIRFQALQHRLAEMFVEIQETRSILYRGLAYIEAPAAERRAAVSAAKVVAANAGRVVGEQGIQLHGGVGMTQEYQVGHYYKRLIALEKSFGDVDYHLERLAGSGR
jgi:alkylation response protein AidB-like acyl-CoA dehydrogenase